MTATRRLAAIMAIDVVGYSRLMGEDEAGTARAVGEHRDAARPIVADHGGRIVKTTGDGILLEFSSVVAAVECAVAIQKLMVERNAGTPKEKRIVYRIGVNLCDVLIEGDDILGDGVNIAARLEGICEPGGVLISGSAYDHVRGRIDAHFVDLGEKALKNISRPVRAYAVEIGAPANPATAKSGKPIAPKRPAALALLVAGLVALVVIAAVSGYRLYGNRTALVASNPSAAAHLSIVVLPFTNLSNDPAQDYFADGVTDNLTTDLSRIRNSFVIARNTAFTYKGKNLDAKEIGKELGVRYVFEGSVQRDGTRVRVNAQLIDAESGAHLWAERFEEDVADLFKLQDQVVGRLANSLGSELVKAEAEKGAHSKNPDAIDLTMRALRWQEEAKPTKDKNDEALALFEQALKIDPNDAEALAGEATCYAIEQLFWANPETDYDAKVIGLADRAIALAPENMRAYWAKSAYLVRSRRADESLRTADAGLAINPNYASLYSIRSTAKSSLGQFEQAKSDAQLAIRLSPRDPLIGLFHVQLGVAELGLGHFHAAIDEYHNATDAGFRPFFAYSNLAAAYALEGRMDEAKTALAEARRLNPKLTVKWMIVHTPNLPPVFEGLRKAGLPEE
jgi:adenylate cyclase